MLNYVIKSLLVWIASFKVVIMCHLKKKLVQSHVKCDHLKCNIPELVSFCVCNEVFWTLYQGHFCRIPIADTTAVSQPNKA